MKFDVQIAVIVVTYNASKWLKITLTSLNKLARIYNLYIVDNKSTDNTLECLNKIKNIEITELSMNLGFGKACNVGITKALKDGNKYFILLNQDAIIDYENLNTLIDVHISNPDYGILSPIHYFDRFNIDKKHLNTLIKGSSQLINDLLIRKSKDLYDIGYTNAAVWCISYKCVELVGGFDPLFSHYGEDCDYAYRANLKGLKVGVCLNSIAYHMRNQNTSKVFSARQYYINFLTKVKKIDKSLIIHIMSLTKHVFFVLIRKFFRGKWREILIIFVAYIMIFKNIVEINKSRKISNGNQKFAFLSIK